jgi:spermidine/putrescine-binding protein
MHTVRPLRLLRPSLVAALIAAGAVSARTTRAAEQVNIFAWSEYIPQAIIDGFTKETGIKVNYETYASGEEMLSKLLIGGATYDLVQPPD